MKPALREPCQAGYHLPAPDRRAQEREAERGSECGTGVVLRPGRRGARGFNTCLLHDLAHSTERAPVTLHLDGIVQVLNCHLSDMAIGMMTRIAVLKWLYHLYIKTPRKVSPWARQPRRPFQAGGCFGVHLGFRGPPRAW